VYRKLIKLPTVKKTLLSLSTLFFAMPHEKNPIKNTATKNTLEKTFNNILALLVNIFYTPFQFFNIHLQLPPYVKYSLRVLVHKSVVISTLADK
jgi:hypothetical protein